MGPIWRHLRRPLLQCIRMVADDETMVRHVGPEVEAEPRHRYGWTSHRPRVNTYRCMSHARERRIEQHLLICYMRACRYEGGQRQPGAAPKVKRPANGTDNTPCLLVPRPYPPLMNFRW